MTEDDARVVVLLGLAMHDVGMSIHRDRHELLERADRPGLAAAQAAADLRRAAADGRHLRSRARRPGAQRQRTLPDARGRHRQSRRRAGHDQGPLAQGASAPARSTFTRSRPRRSRRCASRAATNKPIRVEVDINNPSAVFHLKEVFGQKLAHSSLEPYVEVPKLDELLETLRELGTSEDPQRDAEAAATTAGDRAPTAARWASRSASAAAACPPPSPELRVTARIQAPAHALTVAASGAPPPASLHLARADRRAGSGHAAWPGPPRRRTARRPTAASSASTCLQNAPGRPRDSVGAYVGRQQVVRD